MYSFQSNVENSYSQIDREPVESLLSDKNSQNRFSESNSQSWRLEPFVLSYAELSWAREVTGATKLSKLWEAYCPIKISKTDSQNQILKAGA